MVTRRRAKQREVVRDPVQANLRELSRGPGRPAGAPRLLDLERAHGLRFIAQTRARVESARVEAAIRADHKLVCQAQSLFANVDADADINGMERFFLLTFQRLSRRDIGVNVFDLAYRLLEGTVGVEFTSVEPDLPHAVYVGNPDDRLELSAWGCNVPDTGAPEDHHWHLRNIRAPDAWNRAPGPGGRQFGEGIVIGHPDTGWADHVDLDREALDLGRGWDFIDDDDDAADPLERGFLWPVSPGHGTAAGSVIVSRGSVDPAPPADSVGSRGVLAGIAPGATLVPIRAIRFPAFVFDADVARAIRHAADRGCHVISMSLGGIGTPALEAAVNYAVAKNVIVCAAAGNCVGFVVAPAVYRNCIGVAGSNQHDRPWPYSSRGPDVDITAPAEHVWVARRQPGESSKTQVGLGQGTSFAVAAVAGVAALWLAFHGRDQLLATYRDQAFLQHVFLHILRATARTPAAGWDTNNYGPGIVDADAVLQAVLPGPAEVAPGGTLAALTLTPYPQLISAMFPGVGPRAVEARLAADLGLSPALSAGQRQQRLAAEAGHWGAELIHILAEDRAAYREFRASLDAIGAVRGSGLPAAAVTTRALEPSLDDVRRRASAQLRAKLVGGGQSLTAGDSAERRKTEMRLPNFNAGVAVGPLSRAYRRAYRYW